MRILTTTEFEERVWAYGHNDVLCARLVYVATSADLARALRHVATSTLLARTNRGTKARKHTREQLHCE